MGQKIEILIKPDLQTRESVMVAAGRVQLALTAEDGGVRYVKIEAKQRQQGGGYVKGTVLLEDATHVFVSEKGYGTPRLGCYYPPKGKHTTGRLFLDDGIHEADGHVQALKAAVNFINTGELCNGFVGIEAESACGLCGRKLEDPVSIKRGIGPDCAGKATGSMILHASAFKPTQEDLKAELEARLAERKAEVAGLQLQLEYAQQQAQALEAEIEALTEPVATP